MWLALLVYSCTVQKPFYLLSKYSLSCQCVDWSRTVNKNWLIGIKNKYQWMGNHLGGLLASIPPRVGWISPRLTIPKSSGKKLPFYQQNSSTSHQILTEYRWTQEQIICATACFNFAKMWCSSIVLVPGMKAVFKLIWGKLPYLAMANHCVISIAFY